jgi:hypothetical protein
MGEDKIRAFYNDPVKRASDADSRHRAYRLRALSTDPRLDWQARRLARFLARAAMGRFHVATAPFAHRVAAQAPGLDHPPHPGPETIVAGASSHEFQQGSS